MKNCLRPTHSHRIVKVSGLNAHSDVNPSILSISSGLLLHRALATAMQTMKRKTNHKYHYSNCRTLVRRAAAGGLKVEGWLGGRKWENAKMITDSYVTHVQQQHRVRSIFFTHRHHDGPAMIVSYDPPLSTVNIS